MSKSAKKKRNPDRRRVRATDILKSGEPIYRGSLIQYSRRCGAPSCKCARGQLHKGWALSLSMEGETKVVYIPDRLRREVAAGLKRYKDLTRLLELIAKTDTEALRKQARRYKKRQ